MKKKILLGILSLMTCFELFAQSPKELRLSGQDACEVLKKMGCEMKRFDLSHFNESELTFYIDEYTNGKRKRVHNFLVGRNQNIVPDSIRKLVKSRDNYKRGRLYHFQEIGVYLTPITSSDSITQLAVSDGTGVGFSCRLNIHRLRPGYLPRYQAEAVHDTKGEKNEYPLLFFGSAWQPKGSHVLRFCGSIDDKKKSSPHYYILGIQVSPIKKK